jgi:Zn-dependent protease with chaperone function
MPALPVPPSTSPTSAGGQWETFPRTLILTLAVFLLAVVAAYWMAMPLVVNALARRVPQSALDAIGRQTMAALDREVMQPSALPESRRRELTAAFDRLSLAPDLRRVASLEFRRSDALGANALALPSGTLIVTDGLVELSREDGEILAVLAHEVGHLEGRHGMRAVIQRALLSTLITLIGGDVTSLAAAAPAALLDARYSRGLEREADAFAVATLRANGIAPTRLADILERMEQAHTRAGGGGPSGALAYLSTHPTTEERLQALRQGSE